MSDDKASTPGGEPSASAFEALGLYDPAAPEAADRLELLRYLTSLGATTQDLLEYRDELSGLGTVLITRPGPPELTGPEVSERTGISDEFLSRLWLAAGFPVAQENLPTFSSAELELVHMIAAARTLFGDEAVIQLARVIGSSLARIADATVSAFLVNIEVPIAAEDPAGLAVAKANVAAASLLPGLSNAMDVLLRRHILAARRSLRSLQEAGISGFEVQRLTVGFVDLVGSSTLTQQLSVGDLGRALSEFESRAADEIVAHRGRLVKLIGDEVMYVAADPASACEIALAIAGALDAHPVLPPVRAGVASGDVIMRDGDYFGPVVTLAARAVKEGAPGTVTVDGVVAAAVRDRYLVEPLERRRLKGLGDDVALFSLARPG